MRNQSIFLFRSFVIFNTVLLLPFFSFANYNIDSLNTALSKRKPDSNKVKTLKIIADSLFIFNDFSNAFVFGKKALKLSEQIHYEKEKGEIYFRLGMTNVRLFDNVEALRYLQNALKEYNRAGDKAGEAYTYTENK